MSDHKPALQMPIAPSRISGNPRRCSYSTAHPANTQR
jgi:hypothetical protein